MITRSPVTASRVALRPMALSDLPLLHQWYSGSVTMDPTPMARLEAEYVPAILDPSGASAWHSVIESAGRPVGSISYTNVDAANHSCRVGLLITDPQPRGSTVAGEALCRLLSLLFGVCGMHRVWTEVAASDTPAISLFHAAGFREEGVRRDAVCARGEWIDLVMLSLIADER